MKLKIILVVSVLINVYLIVVTFLFPIGSLGGGKCLEVPESGINVGLNSYTDFLGFDAKYMLSFSKSEEGEIFSTTYDYLIFKPPEVVSWGALREAGEEVLRYDDTSHEIICKVPGYTIKIGVFRKICGSLKHVDMLFSEF
jgi:hypothetical protein